MMFARVSHTIMHNKGAERDLVLGLSVAKNCHQLIPFESQGRVKVVIIEWRWRFQGNQHDQTMARQLR